MNINAGPERILYFTEIKDGCEKRVPFSKSYKDKRISACSIFFFYFNEIDERRSYSKKVHPLKAWVGSSIVKRRRRADFMGSVGV